MLVFLLLVPPAKAEALQMDLTIFGMEVERDKSVLERVKGKVGKSVYCTALCRRQKKGNRCKQSSCYQ